MIQGGIDRPKFAGWLAAAALWCLPVLALVLPHGLAAFGMLLLASWWLLPGQRLQRLQRGRAIAGQLQVLAALALAVVALAIASRYRFGLGWDVIDNCARLLLLPVCALWAYVLHPPRRLLWTGALVGLVAAFALAAGQVAVGLPRAHGWNNAIVFAEVVAVLMTLAAFCRPPGRHRLWMVGALLLGVASIVLSGSRGVWLALPVLLLVLALGGGWKSVWLRLLVLAGVLAAAAALAWFVPVLSHQARFVELHQDIDRYEHGDSNSSAGARLQLLDLAGKTFLQHPLTGIGIGQFGKAVRTLPECGPQPGQMLCRLDHAHNDFAEWAATLGIAGAIAIVAIYALPLWWFVRLIRACGLQRRPRGCAWTGAMLVVVYVLCGQTQSMFAHQLTASLYAALVGILFGLALREAEPPQAR